MRCSVPAFDSRASSGRGKAYTSAASCGRMTRSGRRSSTAGSLPAARVAISVTSVGFKPTLVTVMGLEERGQGHADDPRHTEDLQDAVAERDLLRLPRVAAVHVDRVA